MTVRLAVATAAEYRDLHEDDRPLLPALRAAGVEPVVLEWTDPSVDWSAYDAVLIRSVWDYARRPADFVAWLDQLAKAEVLVLNDLDLVRWNLDKSYLLQLRERGVPIVPTQVAAGACLREVVAGLAGTDIVVKPAIGAGAYDLVRGVAGSPELDEALAGLPEQTYLVQPFQPQVQTDGELSLVYFDGRFSHAVLKRPADGDFRVQHWWGGAGEIAEPSPAVLDAAALAIAATGPRPPAYARVDGIVVGGRFLLMELELVEPFLYPVRHPPALEIFAAVIAGRLGVRPGA